MKPKLHKAILRTKRGKPGSGQLTTLTGYDEHDSVIWVYSGTKARMVASSIRGHKVVPLIEIH